jgi:hypothetical protein
MSVILASASNADGATTTSSAYAYNVNDALTATCAISSTTPPSTGCDVVLQLSADNVTYVNVDRKHFGIAAGVTYSAKFELADYGNSQNWGLNSAWAYLKLQFTGNTGAAVTVAASGGDTSELAVVTLTGVAATTGGAIAAWTPPQGGPILITNVVVYCTANSGGAANLSVGVANNATTNSVTLINAQAIGSANNSIIVSGGANSTQQGLLTGSQSVTFTGSANSVGFAGKAYITYIRT